MMDSPPDPFMEFCGIDLNASDFTHKFVIDSSSGTFTHCWELGFVGCLSLPILFFTIINLCEVTRGFPRFDNSWINWIFSLRLFVCVYILIALIVSFVLALATDLYSLPSAQLIEYGYLMVVWTVYGALWTSSIYCKSWSRSVSLYIGYALASKCFIVIAIQRWMFYGSITDPRVFIFVSIVIILILNSIGIIAEWRIHKSANSPAPLHDEYIQLAQNADEEASYISRLFFFWTNILITKGRKRQLNIMNDVFELPPSLHVDKIEEKLIENSPSYFSDGEHFSITRALLRTFGLPFFLLAIPRLISDLFTFAGPVLLHLLVSTLEDPEPTSSSWWYAGGMMGTTFVASLSSAHFNFLVQKMSLRVRAATVTSIFDKLMRVPLSQLGTYSSGQIINFVSSDVDRIVNFCNSFHAFWSLPVQFVIAIYLLEREVGSACLAGVAAATVLIPINKYITGAIGRQSEKMMACKDQRVKLISETMSGMRAVKMSAWEEFFEKRIGQLRRKELVHLKARKYLDAICVYLWASAPLLITVSILATYTILLHERLTAAKVFTSLALVNILIMPLNAFPWVLNGLIEAFVSIRRLDSFFSLKDIEYDKLYTLSDEPNTLLQVEEASFSWKTKEDADRVVLQGINLLGLRGSIIGIGGPVGSGKSTLLMGILGETVVNAEKIGLRQETLDGGIAYVGQNCWLSRGSIRDNIVCGQQFNADLYEKVLDASCLLRDIKTMPGGDDYEISENGATLSGGQRVRVMLARALYQDNTIYLLDDPFACLDRQVADTIWKEAVEGMMKSRGKLVLVASHDNSLLARADRVIMLGSGGRVETQGDPSHVLKSAFDELSIRNEGTEEIEEEDIPTEYIQNVEEEKQEGAVRVSVYASYARATGAFLVTVIILSILLMQILKNMADWWLTRWTNGQSNGTDACSVREVLMGERKTDYLNDDSEMSRSIYFLSIYSAIALANTIFTLSRAFLFAKGGIVAASELHWKLLHKLLLAPLSWWDRTPAGRVINRMCADVYTVDDSLPFQLNIFLASLFNLGGALVITLIGLPVLIPLVVFLFILYYFIQMYYRMTTVELKRLSSLSLSPLYSVLSDSVNGLASIRAHRFVERTAGMVRERLSGVIRTNFSSLAASQWLTIRLSFIALIVVSCVSFAAILQHRLHFVDSGLVGLAVTYALSMTSLLNGLLGSFIETEKEMVSVERIEEYVDKLPEEDLEGDHDSLPTEMEGKIDMALVCVRYEWHLPLALNLVNLKLGAGQKVAILGRTGSGKSTLFQALLRACKVDSGRISIDGVDTSILPLRQLRRLFGVVPQHPLLFSGTLEENLVVDYTKADRNTLIHLMHVAQLDGLMERLGGLDGEIEEGGRNLSAGERQIVSLCRLLLTKPKIVLIDEATAHMDDRTRRKIFTLLNTCLPLCTLLSIVHRPHSLQEYDMVVRMESGRVVSCGPPREEDVKLLQEQDESEA